jgi:hypothetical protein
MSDFTPIPWNNFKPRPPEPPMQLTGEPLFRITGVTYLVGARHATVELECAFISATAEHVSVDVVRWLEAQGPNHRVTLGQLYSPLPTSDPADHTSSSATSSTMAS